MFSERYISHRKSIKEKKRLELSRASYSSYRSNTILALTMSRGMGDGREEGRADAKEGRDGEEGSEDMRVEL